MTKEMQWAEEKLKLLPHHYVELFLYKVRSGHSLDKKTPKR